MKPTKSVQLLGDGELDGEWALTSEAVFPAAGSIPKRVVLKLERTISLNSEKLSKVISNARTKLLLDGEINNLQVRNLLDKSGLMLQPEFADKLAAEITRSI